MLDTVSLRTTSVPAPVTCAARKVYATSSLRVQVLYTAIEANMSTKTRGRAVLNRHKLDVVPFAVRPCQLSSVNGLPTPDVTAHSTEDRRKADFSASGENLHAQIGYTQVTIAST